MQSMKRFFSVFCLLFLAACGGESRHGTHDTGGTGTAAGETQAGAPVSSGTGLGGEVTSGTAGGGISTDTSATTHGSADAAGTGGRTTTTTT